MDDEGEEASGFESYQVPYKDHHKDRGYRWALSDRSTLSDMRAHVSIASPERERALEGAPRWRSERRDARLVVSVSAVEVSIESIEMRGRERGGLEGIAPQEGASRSSGRERVGRLRSPPKEWPRM